jgi:hypothetical protein
MHSGTRRIREPVQREGAAHYVLISVVAFAVTVIVTRVFLALTGYPQLGTSTLHCTSPMWCGAAWCCLWPRSFR